MKNQESLNETKSKNKEHYPKLNNDRVNKKCEYAVLVSTLEPDNENFNQGIVKVPGYDKMYVVRPQFFLTIIGLIRDASFGVAHYKTEITKYKEINLDVTNFEDRLNDFQDKFHKNVESAKKRHSNAIDEIDKAIAKLQKAKEELLGSSAQLNLADDKAQGLTIRKLTHNNKTLKEAFKKVNEDENSSPES